MRRLVAATVALTLCMACQGRELRVCADPNNLPYSNQAGEGFENRIVQLIAQDLGATVVYTWWAQRRGAIRNTLNAQACDVIPGIASNTGLAGTSSPYYRSTYVFVRRADRANAAVVSLNDPKLHTLRVGVQLVGDDGATTPPAQALARRGITDNVRGYMVYGDYRDRTPQSAIIDAVANGDIDLATAWGPTAGYFALLSSTPLILTPVWPWLDAPTSPMVFDISMGMRRNDRALRREINAVLERRKEEIRAILQQFGVPMVSDQAANPEVAPASDH